MSMTVLDYFKGKNESLGIEMSDTALDVFMMSIGVDGEEEVDSDNLKPYDKDFLRIVLNLLAIPDIKEDSYTITYDREAIKLWYKAEAQRLGVRYNDLDSGIVQNMSFLA